MQAHYPPVFDREMGCTEAEWLIWLPGAVRDCPLSLDAHGARVAIEDGRLHLSWQTLPPRRIALIRIPRLAVQFRFEALADPAREHFMRYFDLYMQRGGG